MVFSARERRLIASLRTPLAVQRYLNALPYNNEPGGRATLRYFTLDDPKGTQTRLVRVDRRWFPARHCRRDDSTGTWPCTDLPDPAATQPEKPAKTTFVATGDAQADRLAPSLVLVTLYHS